MSVHQLPDGRWICKFPLGTLPEYPKRTKEYFGRGPEGERKANVRNAELGIGVAAKKVSTPIFDDIATAYLQARGPSMTPSSLKSVMQQVKGTILPFFSGVQAHEITHDKLDAFVAHYRTRRVKNCTINGCLTFVFAIMHYAHERELVVSNPAQGYRKLKNDGERIRPPNRPEFDAIIAVAPKHLQRAMWLVFYCAIRPGPVELYGLTWNDVDFFNRTLSIKSASKGGMPTRDIPISDKLMILLKQWREEDRGKRLPYIIQWGGKRVGEMIMGWKMALKRAGITRRLRLYDLRHMSATAMLSAGADLKAVSQILGHSSPVTTIQVYQHVINSQRVEAVSKL